VSATLWPTHAHVKVEKNDVVVLEGSYKSTEKDKDGEKVTYHNVSVQRIAVIGKADPGKDLETTADDEDDSADDGEEAF
jgi:hypothetical protein